MKGDRMTTRAVVLLVAVAAAVGAIILTNTTSSSGAAPIDRLATAASPEAAVAARVGNHIVTVEDVDERWRQETPAEQVETMRALYEGRKAALRRIVGDLLIEDAAGSAGMDTSAFADREIVRRARPVSDDDVLTFYASNRERLGEASLDELRPRIRVVLERQQRDRAHAALVDDLSRRGPSVRVLLEPPRLTVPVGEDDPATGSEGAAVTLVVFSDFQCPFCARVAPTLRQVQDEYGEAVQVVWKDFPLTSVHPEAFKAAEASHCAAEQRKYWEYHARLFERQAEQSEADLRRYARELGLDQAAFGECLDSSRHFTRVREGLEVGARLGVQATPTVFVNGRMIAGAQPLDAFAAVIDEELGRR